MYNFEQQILGKEEDKIVFVLNPNNMIDILNICINMSRNRHISTVIRHAYFEKMFTSHILLSIISTRNKKQETRIIIVNFFNL